VTRGWVQKAGPWAVAGTFAISFLVLVLAGIYSVERQRAIDRKICTVTVENRAATRRTWIAAQTFIMAQNAGDTEANVRTREFFQAVLSSIPPLECVDRKPVPL